MKINWEALIAAVATIIFWVIAGISLIGWIQ